MVFEDYVHNTEEIERLSFFPAEAMSDSQYIDHLLKVAERIHTLCRENIRLLNEKILPVLDHIEDQPPERIPEFVQFAQSLLSYNQSLDRELNYRTHLALLQYVRRMGDFNLLVQELYYCGMGFYSYITDQRSSLPDGFHDPIGHNLYFREAAQYLRRWREIDSPQAMDFVIRCFCNQAFDYNSTQDIEAMMLASDIYTELIEFLQQPGPREKFPGLPWDRFLMAAHQNRTSGLGIVREKEMPQVMLDRIVESAEYINYERAQKGKVHARWRYALYAAHYHHGDDTLDQFLEKMYALFDERNPHDYFVNGIWENMTLPMLIIEYHSLASQKAAPEEAEKLLRSKKALAPGFVYSILDYTREFSNLGYEPTLIRTICQIMLELFNLEDIPFKDIVIRLVMQRHAPTYIHSQMVARLSVALAEALIEREPMRFAGLLGAKSPEEVRARRTSALEMVYNAGMMHDLGKLLCLEAVGVYNRRLFDTEFDIIRNHPLCGYVMLRGDPSTVLYAQSALMHHMNYDGKRGYPSLPEDFRRDPRLDVLTDLITVADSMDAATDFIGRSYSTGISFERLLGEYREGYDTRYAGYVIDLLDDEPLLCRLQDILTNGRKELYLECYHRFRSELERQ